MPTAVEYCDKRGKLFWNRREITAAPLYPDWDTGHREKLRSPCTKACLCIFWRWRVSDQGREMQHGMDPRWNGMKWSPSWLAGSYWHNWNSWCVLAGKEAGTIVKLLDQTGQSEPLLVRWADIWCRKNANLSRALGSSKCLRPTSNIPGMRQSGVVGRRLSNVCFEERSECCERAWFIAHATSRKWR